MRIGIDCRKIRDFGIGTYIRGLLSALPAAASGESLVVFVPSDARDLVPPAFERVILDTPNYTVREMFTLARAIDRARLDLFHSPHYVIPFTRCPSVVTLHDVILFRFRPRRRFGAFYVKPMTRRAARKSVRILTVTHAAKADLVSELRCDPEKITVTPNGISTIADVPPAAGRYFLFVGNDKAHKNADRLADAFASVRHTDLSVELVMAGSSFSRLGAREGLRIEGFVSEERLAALYRGALALVIPSLDEGFGLPALEAMSCGTPVIASDIPALREVTGSAALHVDPRSTNAIAEAMRRVATDEALRRSLAIDGVERAHLFTWARCAEGTMRAYRQSVN